MDKRRRRDIIGELISTDPPASQGELVERLAGMGIAVDQSTISRDLREMGVVRLPGAGGMVYGIPGEGHMPVSEEDLRRGLREFVIGIEASGNIVILHTAPGNAHALAVVLDASHLGEVAGTVAGDDTIMVVVREGYEAGEVAARFKEAAGL